MWLDGPLQNPTFGVEMEFIIRHIPHQTAHGELYQVHIHEQLRQHLKEAGVAVNSQFGPPTYSAWIVDSDASIRPYEEEDDDIHSKIACTGVELISRVLPVNRAGFEEIRSVVGLVRAKFDVKVNQSTGLHVHVGNGTDGFNNQCIQNLAQLVTVFQHQIDSIHPDSRINAFWAMPPSDSDALHVWEGPFAAAEVLQENERETIELMNPHQERSMAYNFTNLVDDWRKRTIEFRQHQGSVNAGQIVAWAEFVTALVSYCHSISPQRFLKLILRFGTDKNFSVLHLMQIIGKPHLVEYYRDKLVSRERPRIALPNPSVGNSRSQKRRNSSLTDY